LDAFSWGVWVAYASLGQLTVSPFSQFQGKIEGVEGQRAKSKDACDYLEFFENQLNLKGIFKKNN
jgi:hypothetical protein